MIGGSKVHHKIQGNEPWSKVTKELSSLAKPHEKCWGFMMKWERCFLTTPPTS